MSIPFDETPQNTALRLAAGPVKSDSKTELGWLRNAEPDALRDFARAYDWTRDPETVLGWVMAQPKIDLVTALTVFFNGIPERFNTLAHRDVPRGFRGEAQLLDTICQRINAGFYLAYPENEARVKERASDWLEAQDRDSAAGRKGRYLLDPAIIETVLDGALTLDPSEETALYAPKASILRDVLSPVIGLGVSRHDLRYLPDPPPEEEPEIEL
ncbi:MAG: hypothetical protein AAFO72_13140 [Pseudomonadota bacterium]